MTRKEFLEAYAERSGKKAEWAGLGFIEHGGRISIALPCACGEDGCEGWALVSNEAVLDHLFFRAPDDLRDAYQKAVAASGGE